MAPNFPISLFQAPLATPEAAPVVSDEKRSSISHDNDEQDDHARDVALYGEGVEFPTQEEIATLRRIADKMPLGAFAIVISSFVNGLHTMASQTPSKTTCKTPFHLARLPAQPRMAQRAHSTRAKQPQQVSKTRSPSSPTLRPSLVSLLMQMGSLQNHCRLLLHIHRRSRHHPLDQSTRQPQTRCRLPRLDCRCHHRRYRHGRHQK